MMQSEKQYGLTIVELLVALALSAVLATALYRIVLANQQGMALTESYSKIQDASRTAFDLLQYDLRMINYRGCINDTANITNNLNNTSSGYDAGLHDFTAAGPAVESRANYVSPDSITADATSDTIVLRAAIPIDLMVAESTANNITVAGQKAQFDNLKPGDVLMVTDCEEADIFSISGLQDLTPPVINHLQAVSTGLNNNSDSLSKLYARGASVLLMHTVVYFVAESQLLSGTGINSLYSFDSMDGTSDSRELVPYVQGMRVSYLVDNGTSRSYQTSPSGNVLATRVELDMATEKSCDAPNAKQDSCIEPQTYERVFFVRNSRSQL